MDGACTTGSDATAKLSAGETEVVSEDPQEWGVLLYIYLMLGIIDLEFYHGSPRSQSKAELIFGHGGADRVKRP